MFSFVIFKISFFSKLIILDFNNLIFLFNIFFLLLKKFFFLNCYYFFNIVNITWILKKKFFKKNFSSRRLNIFYQKKYLNIDNFYYNF